MKKLIFLFLAAALTFSCSSDDDSSDRSTNPPSRTSFINLINQAKANKTATQQYNLVAGGQLIYTSPKGVVLTINQACLKLNGQDVTGNVTLKYLEVFEAEDMVTTGVSTMGYNQNNHLEILKTGGAFNIEVYKDNTLLTLDCGYSLQVPVNLTGGHDNNMVLWTGALTDNQQIAWTQNPDVGGIERGNNTYYTFLNTFGWINLDRFYDDNRPRTNVSVKVPQMYHFENSVMYFAFDTFENSLGAFNSFDGSTNSFKESYGTIPVGITMHVIFVSEQNGSFKYAIKTGTVTANHTFEFVESDLRTASPDTIEDAIDDLF